MRPSDKGKAFGRQRVLCIHVSPVSNLRVFYGCQGVPQNKTQEIPSTRTSDICRDQAGGDTCRRNSSKSIRTHSDLELGKGTHLQCTPIRGSRVTTTNFHNRDDNSRTRNLSDTVNSQISLAHGLEHHRGDDIQAAVARVLPVGQQEVLEVGQRSDHLPVPRLVFRQQRLQSNEVVPTA